MSKKEQVIESARELFSEYGYKRVSMDEIAKESGVTKKTIYTYFKDKTELIKFFLYEELEKMKLMTKEVNKEKIPYIEKINKLILKHFEYRSNSKLLQAFSKDGNLNLEIASSCEKILNQNIQGEIKRMLITAIDDGYIKDCDTDIMAFVIYKIYIALMFEWEKPFDKDKATAKIMDFMKYGLFNRGMLNEEDKKQ